MVIRRRRLVILTRLGGVVSGTRARSRPLTARRFVTGRRFLRLVAIFRSRTRSRSSLGRRRRRGLLIVRFARFVLVF